MIESRFVSTIIVGGKPRKVIVDICRDIINRNPTKEELKSLRPYSKKERSRNWRFR